MARKQGVNITGKLREQINKIELYFFDSSKHRNEYIDKYKIYFPDRYSKEGAYRYSPLFLICKDIRYCFAVGKEFNTVRKEIFPANFTGIILIDIAYHSLIEKFYQKDFNGFVKKYMGISEPKLLWALEKLRDALVHSNYSLFIRDREKKKKIYFSLGFGYQEIIIQNNNWKTDYPSEMYNVNPRALFIAFEQAINSFKKDILKDSEKISNFDNNISIDEWTVVK